MINIKQKKLKKMKKMGLRKRGTFISVLGVNGVVTPDGIIVDQALLHKLKYL